MFTPRVPSHALKDYRYVQVDGKGRLLHRVRAERALGKPLPPKAVVHHVDDRNPDDSPLVICENQKYHLFLHCRQRVVRAGGDPNTQRICGTCKQLTVEADYSPHAWIHYGQCRACNTAAARSRKAKA